MAQDRFKKIKGTKDFLVVAVVCGFLCVWAVLDGWFTPKKVLKKHPLEFAVTNSIHGVVQSVPVKPGDKIDGTAVLVELAPSRYQKVLDEAEAAFKAAKESEAGDVGAKLAAVYKARANLTACTVRNTDFKLTTNHGEDSLHGKVLDVFARPAMPVETGDVLMIVRPKDTFYIFNKSLAVLSFIGAIVALFFHRVASK